MLKILIVDDSVFSQKINANMIKKQMSDIEIHFAGDGVEGFEKYREISPDYIFLDLLMPKMDGKELIGKITAEDKDKDKKARIFVVSADVQKNVKEEINEYNVKAFINKPFTEEKAAFVCSMIRKDEDE